MATLNEITEEYADRFFRSNSMLTVSLMFPETMAYGIHEELPSDMFAEIVQALDVIALYERRVLNASDSYE